MFNSTQSLVFLQHSATGETDHKVGFSNKPAYQ